MEDLVTVREMFGGVYRGRRVLVTGHTGFKGGWLSLWLSELGAEVHGYALDPPTTPSLFEVGRVGECVVGDHRGDIRDGQRLREVMKAVRPEIVFHLAAQPLVRASYSGPEETYDTNVMGTVRLLEAARAVGTVRVCQVVTSDKCYENREWVYAYRENDAMGGFDPYSSSKGCAELVVSAYRSSFFSASTGEVHPLSLSSVRAGNVIGGGDWAADRILPDCARALGRGESVFVRNPRAIRPWQHVLEPLSGYLHLASRQWHEPEAFAESWNFGPTAAGNVTVREIVEEVARSWGRPGAWSSPESETYGADQPHEARSLKLDITKAQTLLGWQPVFSVTEAISETVRWYRAYMEDPSEFDAQRLCLDQIAQYTEKARIRRVHWAYNMDEGRRLSGG